MINLLKCLLKKDKEDPIIVRVRGRGCVYADPMTIIKSKKYKDLIKECQQIIE